MNQLTYRKCHRRENVQRKNKKNTHRTRKLKQTPKRYRRRCICIKKISSDESIIYTGTYFRNNQWPIIDLTKSSTSIHLENNKKLEKTKSNLIELRKEKRSYQNLKKFLSEAHLTIEEMSEC